MTESRDKQAEKIMHNMARTAAAMQMPCGLFAVSDHDGNVMWSAFIGNLTEQDRDPEVAYRKMLRRLAAVNKALGTNFAAQMDIARAKGAKEKPC
jgi:uncharacterized protein (DUF302 family)